MVQRFFFYRIDAIAAGTTIGGEDYPAIQAGTHKTQAPLALVKFAFARAEITLDAAIVEKVPVFCCHHTRIVQRQMIF
jgi:hypothetical protein